MSAAPFLFQTSTERGRTGDLDTVLAEARNTDDRELRAQLLTGVAARPDINAAAFKAIFKQDMRQCPTLLAAALNNPAARRFPKKYADLRSWIGPDAFYSLIRDHDNPAEFLPEFITTAHRHSQYPDAAKFVTDNFTADQISDTFNGLLDQCLTPTMGRDNSDLLSSLVQSPFLSAAHTGRIVGFLSENLLAALDGALPENIFFQPDHILGHLGARTDLTVEHAEQVVDCVETLLILEGITNRHYPIRMRPHAIRLLANSTLPQQALVRALASPTISDALWHDRFVTVGLTTATLAAAIDAGADLRLLIRFSLFAMSAKTLESVLDRLSAAETTPNGPANAGAAQADDDYFDDRYVTYDDIKPDPTTKEILSEVLRGATDTIGTPQWDRLYAMWHRVAEADGTTPVAATDEFADIVERRDIKWSDDSATPTIHKFAAWASASPDPALRRHAVKYVYSIDQMRAATGDPDAVVRAQTLDHEVVPEEILTILAGDDSTNIRIAVARHRDATPTVLHLLHTDPSAMVRLEVAKHEAVSGETMRALAGDPDEFVRFVVAEKFLTSLK